MRYPHDHHQETDERSTGHRGHRGAGRRDGFGRSAGRHFGHRHDHGASRQFGRRHDHGFGTDHQRRCGTDQEHRFEHRSGGDAACRAHERGHSHDHHAGGEHGHRHDRRHGGRGHRAGQRPQRRHRDGEQPRGGARPERTLARSIVKTTRRIRRADLAPEQLQARITAAVSQEDYRATMRTLRAIRAELG